MTLLYVALSMIPIIEVESRGLFARREGRAESVTYSSKSG